VELLTFNTLHNLAGQSALLDWLVVFFAKHLGFFLIAGAVWLILREKDWKLIVRNFALVALSVILSRGLLTEIIRFFYHRPRPFVAMNFEPLFNHSALEAALPSGHAAVFFALAFVIFLINRKWGLVYLAAVSLMGLSRVIAGVHWPLDIVAGFLVAALSVFVIKLLLASSKA
jgi:undecaprenyl-diphosphatase